MVFGIALKVHSEVLPELSRYTLQGFGTALKVHSLVGLSRYTLQGFGTALKVLETPHNP